VSSGVDALLGDVLDGSHGKSAERRRARLGFSVLHGQTTNWVARANKERRGGDSEGISNGAADQIAPDRQEVTAHVFVPRLPNDESIGHRGSAQKHWDHGDDYATYPTRIRADAAEVIAETREGDNS